MPKKKKHIDRRWLLVGFAGAILAAPNPTIMRSIVTEYDPFLFNILRSGLVALVCVLPLLWAFGKLRGKSLKYSLLSAFYSALAVTASVLAFKTGPASYVSIIALIVPIITVVLSAKMIGDKITRRAVAGISLAALGAMVIVLLPVAIHQGGSFVFYPLATLFALINALVFPLMIIYYRKANEAGASFGALTGVSSLMIMALNIVLYMTVGDKTPVDLAQLNWAGIIYSGIAVAFVSRILNILCYEHLGAATVGVLSYIGAFFAILIPVFVLGETLSMTMILGGILMFAGVWVIEHHKFKHHRHFHANINH